MTTLIENSLTSDSAFERQKAYAPDWLQTLKQERWAEYKQLPAPVRRDENWRFSNLRKISIDPFHIAESEGMRADDLLSSLHSDAFHVIRLINDRTVLVDDLSGLPDGAIVAPLETAWNEHRDLIREYLYAQKPHLGSEKMSALHNALNRNGVFIFLPEGAKIEKPIWIDYQLHEAQGAVFPYTLIVAGKDSHVSVIEHFHSAEEIGAGFACGATHLYAGENSEVSYLGLQRWNRQSLGFQLNTVEAQTNSRVKNLVLQLGTQHTRHENHSRITGRGAHVDMFSLTVADQSQEIDQRTLQDHCAPGSVSDLLYKNVLADQARTIFSGLIKVEKDAQQTDAYQTNRNLLLNEEADAVSMPGLEILANDVKCSHGATSGQLDESELFYMLSRGIPAEDARKLLVFGFFDELLLKIEQEELQQLVRQLVETRLNT